MSLLNFEYKNFFVNLYEKIMEKDIFSDAAQVAFYFSFALFPLLIFLISIFGFVLESAMDMRQELFYYLYQVMPASAYELVKTTINEVTEGSSGGKLTFGLLVALYSASAGVDNIRIALNSVSNLREQRSWFKTKGIALLLTFALAVLIAIALAIVFYGGKLIKISLETLHLPISSPILLAVLQWIIILIVLLIVFALIFNFLPNHTKPFKWIWISPGTISGIILWLLLSGGFRLYLAYFDSYNKTYGSLGAMIILLLWLYLTALVILIGGSINSTLQDMTDPESDEKISRAEADKGTDASKTDDSATNKNKADGKKIENKTSSLIESPAVIQTTALNRNLPEEAAASLPDEENLTVPPNEMNNKSWVNLAVGGLFGVLVGLMIKRKDK